MALVSYNLFQRGPLLRFRPLGLLASFEFIANFGLVSLAHVSGASVASGALSLPSFRYISRFWVCFNISGLFPSFGFIGFLRVRLRILGS